MIDCAYGGFWRRAMAAVIDMIILWFIYAFLFVIGAVAGFSGAGSSAYNLQPDALLKTAGGFIILYQAFCILINIAYYTYFHGIMGQTPGKMAMGLKVMQDTGDEMTFGIAFLRWVGSIVSGLCFFLGYIWVACNRRKQGWHDKIAGTVVIMKKEKYLDKVYEI